MTIRCLSLAILSAIVFTSCDSDSGPSPVGTSGVKPHAKHHSAVTFQIHYTRPYELDGGHDQPKNFLNNQIAILSSNGLIDEAAKEMAIDAEIIKSSLWIEPIPDTDLVTLTAFHDNADMAKAIAETVMKTYLNQRGLNERRRAQNALNALDEELILQQDLVQEHRKALTVLIQQYGIPYFDGRSENPIGVTEEEMYRNAQLKLDEFEAHRAELALQVETLKQPASEDLVRAAAGLEIEDNQVLVYYRSHREHSEKLREMLASGLGKEHPEIIKTQKLANQALENAQAEIVALKKHLETKLKLADRQIVSLKEIVGSKQESTIDLSLKQHQYNQAKEDYEQARDMYREMKIKQQESRVMLKMPRTPVTIHGWHHE